MRIERFKAADLSELDVQAAQLATVPYFAELGAFYERAGEAYTLRRGDRPVACAGLLWTSLGAHLWAVIAREAPLVALHRLALRTFEVYPRVRLTATAETDFGAGCRWLEMLGFTRGPLLEQYGPDERDHWCYIREPA